MASSQSSVGGTSGSGSNRRESMQRHLSSRRSLGFGLNRSLRYLDTRYVDETTEEQQQRQQQHSEGGIATTRFDSQKKHYGNDDSYSNSDHTISLRNNNDSSNRNHNRNPSIYGYDNENDDGNSGYFSRTNNFSSWSLAARSQDEEGIDVAGGTEQSDYDDNDATTTTTTTSNDGHNPSDDPRSTFFRLLDRHCSVYPSENEDKATTVYDYDHDHDYNYNTNSNHGKAVCNDWEPIREWLEAMTTTPGDDLDEEDDPHKESRDNLLRASVLEARGRSGETVLHVACERSVPIDVMELLLSIEVPRSASLRDDESNEHDGRNTNANTNLYRGKDLALCSTIDGWLPLHYACNYPNDFSIVERLVETFREAKTHADLKGRTPLHFAMREENMNRPEVVVLLASAAGIADDNGILPLHYACLYGATEDFLRILTEAYPAGVASKDRFGRVPLHYSLSNAGKPNAPEAVRLLLVAEPSLVNTPGIARVFSGSDAVRKYAASAKEHDMLYSGSEHTIRKKNNRHSQKRISFEGGANHTKSNTQEVFSGVAVEECLKRFLEAKPNPTADFFTALQSLPEPLREKAVLMRVVQELLNKKIGQRFPTALLLLDLYLQVIVMVSYTLAIRNSITWRFMDHDSDATFDGDQQQHKTQQLFCLLALYLALTYFLFREIVQIIGLVSLKASWIWVYEPGNWLNVTYIAVIGTWTILATTGKGDNDVFRNGAALSFAILWLKFLSYLRKILIDFSVFSGGVFHVLRRLLAFLMCLTIILIAFSRMFFALFYETEYCKEVSTLTRGASQGGFGDEQPPFFSTLSSPFDDEAFTKDLICEANDKKIPWCNAWDSFLAVYTMLLGEVDETVFGDNTTALVLFVVFVLLVVILLANVLIAIVTDSYKVIRDKRAAIVFWTNRLDFIAQMDAIANGPWKSRLRSLMGLPKHNESSSSTDNNTNNYYFFEESFGKALCNDIVELFEHETFVEDGIFSFDFVLCALLRLAALFLVPLWILAGALSVGLLWPPQIRERLFVGSITTSYGSKSEQEETLRKTEIENLKGEIALLKHDLVRESSKHKTQIVQMKSAVAERKLETLNTLTTIKKNVVLALELCEIGREG